MKNKLGYDDSLDVFGIHGGRHLGGYWPFFFLRPGTTDNTVLDRKPKAVWLA